MKKAEEMRRYAENAQKEREEGIIKAAQMFIDEKIMPVIESKAKEGCYTVRVGKLPSVSANAQVENLLRANGYKVDFAGNNEIRISW